MTVKKAAKAKPQSSPIWTWAELNKKLRETTETETKALLDLAVKEGIHPTYITRIYGRYNKLRSERELREILSKR